MSKIIKMNHDTSTEHEKLAEIAIYRYYEIGCYILGYHNKIVIDINDISDRRDKSYRIETDTQVPKAVRIVVRHPDQSSWNTFDYCDSPAKYYALKEKLLHESNHDPLLVAIYRAFETQLIQRFVEDESRFERAFHVSRIAPTLAQSALKSIDPIVARMLKEADEETEWRGLNRTTDFRRVTVTGYAFSPNADIEIQFKPDILDDNGMQITVSLRGKLTDNPAMETPFRFRCGYDESPMSLVSTIFFEDYDYLKIDPLDRLVYLMELANINPALGVEIEVDAVYPY